MPDGPAAGAADPIGLLFGGMGKLGPGSDEATRHVLGLLPERRYRLIVDAGCGTGRQTLTLAEATGSVVHAVDVHQAFLDELRRRASAAGVADRVHPHTMDMADIPSVFTGIDLLWSEGSAYTIGFAHALARWRPSLARSGYAVVSELCWLRDRVTDEARAFFDTGYPDMQSVAAAADAAERAGYAVIATHPLPRSAWFADYYDVLGPRAAELSTHPDPAVRALAAETLQEIEVFGRSVGDYGYVFFVLRPRPI